MLIDTMALDKGKGLENWLINHPDTPTPWIDAIHESFSKGTSEISRVEFKKRLEHRNSAHQCAKLILAGLGSKKSLKKHQTAISTDLKRYLYWLGCSGVHELIIGTVERRPTTLRADCENGNQTASAFRNALHQVLHDQYYVKCEQFSDREHLGALIVSLALDGVLNLPELKMAVDQIMGRRIFVIDSHLRYVAGHISNGNAHYRRVHLHDVTFSLACSLPVDKFEDTTTTFLNACVQAFAKRCLSREHHRISLRGLFRAVESYYRLQPEVPQILVDYMKGDIVSNSLNEHRFAQLFGKKPLPELMVPDEPPEQPWRANKDFERPTVINEVKKTLSLRPEKVARQETLIKLDFLRSDQTLKPALRLLLDWVEWIITVKGDRPSYALMSLTNLSQHLLPQLKDLDSTITTPDDWRELIEAITTGLPATHKVFDAIRLMTTYLKSQSADDYEDAGRSQKSSVNARVITPQEIDHAMGILKVRLPPHKFRIAESLIRLAYALGCRRWELLGLQHRDIVGEEDPCLFIRDNSIRTTKTVSSNRCNSLKLCSDQAFYTDFRRELENAPKKDLEKSIFQSADFDIDKDHKSLFIAINKALQAACRDTNVSFHTLRHSAVCQSLLSVFWHEIPVDNLLSYPYFSAIDDRANRIRSIMVQPHLINCFEHESVSQQVGHLSFSTTSENYFHFFDLLRHAFIHKVNLLSMAHDPTVLALAAAGFTRYSRAIRDKETFSDDDYLSLIVNKHSEKLKIYEPDDSVGNTESIAPDTELYASLVETRDRILYLLNIRLSQASHHDDAVCTPDANDSISLQKLTIIERLYNVKINKSTDFTAFISKEPDHLDRRCRMIMASRAESLLLSMDPSEQAEFSNRLMDALSHSAIQKHGHFRFRTISEAERVMTALSCLLSDGPVMYTLTIEQSIKTNGKVKKVYSPEVVLPTLTEVVKEGRGSMLIGFATERQIDLTWYRFRSLVWVCTLIYLKYGTVSPKESTVGPS